MKQNDVRQVSRAANLANDLAHWQTTLLTGNASVAECHMIAGKCALVSSGVVAISEGKMGFRKSLLVRDPDGHVMQLIEK